MKVTVTGAGGFLGAAVTRQLCEAGYTVVATDKFARTDLPTPVRVVDLLNRESCYHVLEGVEAVVHLGNHKGMHRGDPQLVFNENGTMNMNVFQAAAELKVAKVIFASSIQVMCSQRAAEDRQALLPYLPLDSEAPPCPDNPYSLSKLVGETMLAYFADRWGMQTVALRFPALVDDALLDRCQKAGSFPAGSHEAFAYLHVKDAGNLVAAMLKADLPGFRVYFPAARSHGSVRPVAEVIRQYYANVPLRKPLEEIDFLVDISAIERETGWTPIHNRSW